ncbi:MAG: sodium:solute symporter family protein [Bryobacterales bacterium]|nr:sodium:solute symporter family protein [Bryobacterales bacterium]
MDNTFYIVVLGAVVAVLVGVSIQKMLGVKNRTDFLLAGRTLPWHVLVFTLLSSWIGAGSLFAGGEAAYKYGFAGLWQPAGGWCGLAVIAFIAARARRFAQFTVPDLLENRYNPVARVLATLAIVIAYTVITSYQFKGGGDILHLIFGTDRTTGMYVIAGFVILFTAAAGMASVAYLDRIIGGLIVVTVLVSLPILLNAAGGWSTVTAKLPPDHFTLFSTMSPDQAFGLLLPTMLLLVGNQGMYQKFFSARSERDAKLAVYGWIIGTLVLETALITFAVFGSSFLKIDNPRETIPVSAKLGLPPWIGAFLIGGIFAKVISTANNYLFSPATNLIHDVYLRFLNPTAGERQTLLVSRLIVVALGLFALLQAAHFESILKAALYAYTIYGAAVTPSVLAVFFWKRATTSGAIASITLGAAVTIFWNFMGYTLDAVYPAVGASVAALVVVSLLSPPPPESKWKPFFEAEAAGGESAR